MEFKQWLTEQLDEIGIDPTSLCRLVPGLNQPTVQRILSGETPNPRINTTNKVIEAIYIARNNAGLPPVKYTNPLFQSEQKKTVLNIQKKTDIDHAIDRLTYIARSLDLISIGRLIERAEILREEMPKIVKQTPASSA